MNGQYSSCTSSDRLFCHSCSTCEYGWMETSCGHIDIWWLISSVANTFYYLYYSNWLLRLFLTCVSLDVSAAGNLWWYSNIVGSQSSTNEQLLVLFSLANGFVRVVPLELPQFCNHDDPPWCQVPNILLLGSEFALFYLHSLESHYACLLSVFHLWAKWCAVAWSLDRLSLIPSICFGRVCDHLDCHYSVKEVHILLMNALAMSSSLKSIVSSSIFASCDH